MKHLLLILIPFFFSPVSLFAAPKYKIMVDPGHGGEDDGAVNGRYREADLALSVSKKLSRLINSNPKMKAILTRTKDSTLTLPGRVRMAHNNDVDLFLSVHINSSTNPRAQGGEVYVRNQLKPSQEKYFLAQFENGASLNEDLVLKSDFSHMSDKPEVIGILENVKKTYNLKLATLIAKDILGTWGGQKRPYHERIHQAPFFVVKRTGMPSILVELGFISNSKEVKKLANPAYQTRLAKGIYKGVKRYFKRLERTQASPKKNHPLKN